MNIRSYSLMHAQWRRVGAWIGGLILLSIVLGSRLGETFTSLSSSAAFSFAYLPIATIAILYYGRSNFALAAALFYGYLGLSQATNATFFLAGDAFHALTLEEVFAIPLVLVGLSGRAAPHHRRLPSPIRIAWWAITVTGLLSVIAAHSVPIAGATYLGRVLVPLVVTLSVSRRLASIEEYKLVWFGFALGMMAIAAFDYRRGVVASDTIGNDYNQRYAGGTLSFGLPAIYLCGGALWLAIAWIQHRRWVFGGLMLLAPASIIMLMWIGGHRGPIIALSLLTLTWLLTAVSTSMRNSRSIVVLALIALLLFFLAVYSLQKTSFDSMLATQRLQTLQETGLTGQSRWSLWKEGIEYWQESPLRGIGFNNWVLRNEEFESVHGTFVGLLLDMGLMGALAMYALFGQTILMAVRILRMELSLENKHFFIGCFTGWLAMTLLFMVELSMTSGQAKNNIFMYVVFFFPLLTMVTYTTAAPLRGPATAAWRPGDLWAAIRP